ncbi:MAG: hypothetical protein HOP31_00015 [Ignavibacteria bacterium]|nr:hypothetical protein [Ignavibacteria bacterium]
MDLKNSKYNPFFVNDYFLFEYGAIPENVRTEYKKKVLKRKGSPEQKNLKLIEYFERKISTGLFDEKEYSELSGMLNITGRMLDCHKARLIKQLREFYFRWQELPGESEIEKIRRRFSIGMLREARTELIELEKKTLKQKKSIGQKLLLYEISEKLFHYYNFTRDLRRANHYYKTAKRLSSSIVRSKQGRKFNTEIKTRFRLLMSYKLTMNRFKLKNLEIAVGELSGIISAGKKSIPVNLQLKVYHKLGLFYNILRDKDRSITALAEGKELARVNNSLAEKLVFESFLMIRKFSDNNSLAGEFLEFHKRNFPALLELHTDVTQVIEFELNYLRFLIYANDPAAEEITSDYLSRQILYSRKADALNSWYLELSDQHSSSVFEWKKTGDRYSVSVDKNILSVFTEMNRVSTYKFSNIYSPNVQAILYINIAEQEFWKDTKADFLLAETYIKKLERIMKLYNINISSSWIESAKLGLKIFEMLEKQDSEKVYKRFSGAVTRFIIKIKSEKQSFNIASDLAKLLFINDVLKVNRLEQEITGLIEWIGNNHPDVLKSVNESLKK